jgi:hypothetical protein
VKNSSAQRVTLRYRYSAVFSIAGFCFRRFQPSQQFFPVPFPPAKKQRLAALLAALPMD